jgi:hypothetical protein
MFSEAAGTSRPCCGSKETSQNLMNKKDLTERDICSKFIGPAVKRAGWDGMLQIREEVAFTKPNIPIAIIEAKDNNHSIGDGMQQALDYAVTLNIPFVFSSNGDGFVFHDRTVGICGEFAGHAGICGTDSLNLRDRICGICGTGICGTDSLTPIRNAVQFPT